MHVEQLVWTDNPEAPLNELMRFCDPAANTIVIGTGSFVAGQAMPDTGYSQHPMREITLILEGALETESCGKRVRLGAGELITIPAGKRQRTTFLEDTKLVYFFFGHRGEGDSDPDG